MASGKTASVTDLARSLQTVTSTPADGKTIKYARNVQHLRVLICLIQMDGLGVQVFDSGDRYIGLFANNMVRTHRLDCCLVYSNCAIRKTRAAFTFMPMATITKVNGAMTSQLVVVTSTTITIFTLPRSTNT